MIVCIAEKPSVARDIAHILGATRDCGGYMEGNGYQVTWTFGHLCELKEPAEYSTMWKTWSLAQLPMIPARFGIRLKDDKGIQNQFAIIQRLIQNAEGIINCGDAGQEGELIQRWVMQKAGAKCPVRRLWISSLTEEAIREGFNNLQDQSNYQSLYEAGLCRAIGDWLLGLNATRLYTIKYGGGNQSTKRQLLSIGRVQTPTLALIVNRQNEIDNFKPETYWVLTTQYRDVTFTAVMEEGDRGFRTKEAGEAALEAISPLPFTVTSVEKKAGKEAPPRLFDLTSLQVECNKRFSYSAEQTLQLIQSLYEKKVATYPRVDTTFLSDDIYPKCPTILAGLVPYASMISPISGKKLRKDKKYFDTSKVTDHHAIIPTGVNPATVSMTDMEKRVFDLIARRFIGIFYPDLKFQQTTVLGEVRSEGLHIASFDDFIPFKATGKVITDPAWQVLWKKAPSNSAKAENAEDSDEAQADSSKSVTLPPFRKGESGPHQPNLAEKQTTPPKPYTEATLLRAMETAGKFVDDDELRDALKENGIGRPSTRASIIETLFKRNYIRRVRKSLAPTDTGIHLISLIREELLKSAELTGIWEKKLRQIERKEYSAPAFMEELKQMVSDIVLAVMQDNSSRIKQ
ncbi:MAG: DNA topoisomerase 3 [Bacteroidaceae bacterium]|nr:DNA topoisomerase 3 [Bacteroidaceae bacterium]